MPNKSGQIRFSKDDYNKGGRPDLYVETHLTTDTDTELSACRTYPRASPPVRSAPFALTEA